MASYTKINFSYDKQSLLNLFTNSPKEVTPKITHAEISDGFCDLPEFDVFFEKFKMIPRHNGYPALSEITATLPPHANPGNNGLIIFPVAGIVRLTTYEYDLHRQDSNGDSVIDNSVVNNNTLNEIETTLLETYDIVEPIVIDGKKTHTFSPVESPAIIFVLKIPNLVSVTQILNSLRIPSSA